MEDKIVKIKQVLRDYDEINDKIVDLKALRNKLMGETEVRVHGKGLIRLTGLPNNNNKVKDSLLEVINGEIDLLEKEKVKLLERVAV